MTTTVDRATRRLGLDALRGVAVVLMIEQHVGIWLWRGPQPGAPLGRYGALVAVNALGGLAAPLFIVLAGVGAALYAAAGRPSRTLLLRGVALVGFGVALNLLTPTWFSPASWFVLHMLGLSLVLATAWRHLPTPALLGLAAAIIVITPAMQAWLATPVPMDNARMSNAGLPGGALRLGLVEGHFPVLPWLALALAGFAVGRWLAAERLRPVLCLAGAAALTGVGGYVAVRAGTVTSPVVLRAFAVHVFYPASVTVVLLLAAVVLLLLAAVTAVERRRPLRGGHPLVTLGRASLTLLLLHVPLFREATRAVGMFQTLPALATAAVVVAVLAGATLSSRWWRHHEYRYGAEWLLRCLGGGSALRPAGTGRQPTAWPPPPA